MYILVSPFCFTHRECAIQSNDQVWLILSIPLLLPCFSFMGRWSAWFIGHNTSDAWMPKWWWMDVVLATCQYRDTAEWIMNCVGDFHRCQRHCCNGFAQLLWERCTGLQLPGWVFPHMMPARGTHQKGFLHKHCVRVFKRIRVSVLGYMLNSTW